jgi:hypothetical protein
MKAIGGLLEGLPNYMKELKALKRLVKENIHTLFSKTMYSLWNANGRKLVDLHMWLFEYLDCPLDNRGLNLYFMMMVRLFCKVCKEELGF